MQLIWKMLGNEKDLKTLAGIICNRVRIDPRKNDVVHLLMDGYSDNNLHSVERWLRSELWKHARENDPVNVPILADRLFKKLIEVQSDDFCI